MAMSKIPDKTQSDIAKQAKQLKGRLSIGDEAPIGSDFPSILQKLNIILLECPIKRTGSNSFSAIFCRTKVDGKEVMFLGVNTWDYYDRQLFAIAHELYHFLNPSQPHISRDDDLDNPIEKQADWFAAELLLPLQVLKTHVLDTFGKRDINEYSRPTLLRFIARLQCTWWIPYKSIIHRLYEADAIDESTYQELFAVDERDPSGMYYRIGDATAHETFSLLNKQTKSCGTDSANLEVCLRNFEDGIISEEELYDGLQLFDRLPEDFGISFIAEDEDDDEVEVGGAKDEC